MKQKCRYNIERFGESSQINYTDNFLKLCSYCLEHNNFSSLKWRGKREDLVEKYSWALPSYEVIDYFNSFDSITEVCAGNGYWSYLIDNMTSCSVRSFDKKCIDGFYQVKNFNKEEVDTDNLLICWPPSGKETGRNILEDCDPDVFVYIGVLSSNITEKEDFHDFILDKGYNICNFFELPSWPGVDDNCYVYKR